MKEYIPALKYIKPPCEDIIELYQRYPDGGEKGWFAVCASLKTFVIWDIEQEKWEPINLIKEVTVDKETIESVTPKYSNEPVFPRTPIFGDTWMNETTGQTYTWVGAWVCFHSTFPFALNAILDGGNEFTEGYYLIDAGDIHTSAHVIIDAGNEND